MRFRGQREVPAPVPRVWAMLHDPSVLRAVVPGCRRLDPVGDTEYSAVLAAQVGPLADTYRGTFSVEDVTDGRELVVHVDARGRCGRLRLHLDVALAPGRSGAATLLHYDAGAEVGGLVARLGAPALTVVGEVFTAGFFADLERAVRRPAQRTTIVASPAVVSSPTTG